MGFVNETRTRTPTTGANLLSGISIARKWWESPASYEDVGGGWPSPRKMERPDRRMSEMKRTSISRRARAGGENLSFRYGFQWIWREEVGFEAFTPFIEADITGAFGDVRDQMRVSQRLIKGILNGDFDVNRDLEGELYARAPPGSSSASGLGDCCSLDIVIPCLRRAIMSNLLNSEIHPWCFGQLRVLEIAANFWSFVLAQIGRALM